MIRLKGQDAVNEALWLLGENPVCPRVSFYLERKGKSLSVSPQRLQSLLEKKEAVPDDFRCEIFCVWDILPPREPRPGLAFYPAGEMVIVQNRFFGVNLVHGDSRDRWFATSRPVFDNAILWAKATPVIESDYSIDEFLDKLFPRIFFRIGAWKKDFVLLKNARELAETLSQVLGLDWEEVQKTAEKRSMSLLREAGSKGQLDGVLFDTVIERRRFKREVNANVGERFHDSSE